MARKPAGAQHVTQIFPQRRRAPLEGLYLTQRLAATAEKMGRSLVLTNFITDQNGVIAKGDGEEHSHVPAEIKNGSDWRLFQELLAQADVMISSSSYFRRVSAGNSRAQNVLSQFEPGEAYAALGEWRLANGYARRSPDLAVVSRGLDFRIPEGVLRSDRRKIIFTTNAAANSPEASAFHGAGVSVIACGEDGIDARRMIDWLGAERGYGVIMLTAGPGILQLLLRAQRLDYFYVTEAQRSIALQDPSTGRTLLPGGKKVGELESFRLAHQFVQEDVIAEDGIAMAQFFLRYDHTGSAEEDLL